MATYRLPVLKWEESTQGLHHPKGLCNPCVPSNLIEQFSIKFKILWSFSVWQCTAFQFWNRKRAHKDCTISMNYAQISWLNFILISLPLVRKINSFLAQASFLGKSPKSSFWLIRSNAIFDCCPEISQPTSGWSTVVRYFHTLTPRWSTLVRRLHTLARPWLALIRKFTSTTGLWSALARKLQTRTWAWSTLVRRLTSHNLLLIDSSPETSDTNLRLIDSCLESSHTNL